MTCKLCGSRELRLFYTQGDRHQFRFYRCRECRLVVRDLDGTASQEKYLVTRVDPRAPTRRNRAHRQTYGFIRRHLPTKGAMLDLGCGDGTLLWLAREDGWDVRGVELFPQQTKLIRETLGIAVETSDITAYEGVNGTWDCVVLAHVLEHLTDPVAALRKIHRLLKPGGAGILEFPNIDALDARLRRLLERLHVHRRHYAPAYQPGHVQEFCRASFALAARHAALDLEVWETYALNPVKYAVFRKLPIGNKARVLVRRAR